MRRNWWHRWGLPMLMLIAVLCFTHEAVAASHATQKAAKKSKSETTVLKSTKSKSTQTVKRAQPEVRKKRTLATVRVAPPKSKKSAPPSKLRASTASRESPSSTQPKKSLSKLRASAALRETSASPQSAKSAKSHKSTKLRVLALKETKDHKYVKMLVPVPDRTYRGSTTRNKTSAKSERRNRSQHHTAIIPAPALSDFLTPPSVTATAPQPPKSTAPQAEQLPATPLAVVLPAPVIEPPQESTAASATTLAALKEPEPIMEAPPERRPLASVGYTAGRAAFQVKFNGERLLHRLNSAFVLPGDEIFVEVVDSQKKRDYTFQTTLGPERQLGPTRWYWLAPSSPGVYSVKVQRPRSNTTVTLNVFVMVPLDRVEDDGMLNGYRIGHYPTVALRQQAIYTPPRGLIEVTQDIEHMLVSPHFRLRQFLCKQDGDYPKYMILDTRLLNALELLLEKANAHGHPARTLTVMSGYRTPYYNRAIGNSTTYSRHVWGDAADIFIDENPADGRMDDLNQDGEVDSHDAEVLYDLIENQYDSRFQKMHVGGLARYRETSSHGPFVHVDVRGVEARWGAGSTAKSTIPSTQPVALQSNRLSSQPFYWRGERETESAP